MRGFRGTFLIGCCALVCVGIALLFAGNLRATHFDRAYRMERREETAAFRPADGETEMRRATGDAGLVNVNTADRDALCALNGVGPALADRIILEREGNGRFFFPEDLLNVNGIGRKTLQRIASQITLD